MSLVSASDDVQVGDGEQGLKDHRAAWEKLFKDKAAWKEVLGDEDEDGYGQY